MELLTTVTRHNCYGNFLFQEGFFVSRWSRGENHLVGIRKIAAEIEEVEEEVIVDMGTDEVSKFSRAHPCGLPITASGVPPIQNQDSLSSSICFVLEGPSSSVPDTPYGTCRHTTQAEHRPSFAYLCAYL